MELRKRLVIALLCVLPAPILAQQTIAPFKTQQANTVFYVNMGNTTLTTIQKSVTAACAYSSATIVDILPGANPSDTIGSLTSACTTTQIYDQRTIPWTNYACTSGSCTASDNNFVTLDTGQTISGAKSFTSTIGAVDIEASGTVTAEGNEGIAAVSPTQATSSANSSSPPVTTLGWFWTGSSSQKDLWQWINSILPGTNPETDYTLSNSGSPGAHKVLIPFPVSIGSLIMSGTTFQGVTSPSGSVALITASSSAGINGDFASWDGNGLLRDSNTAISNIPLLNAGNDFSAEINAFHAISVTAVNYPVGAMTAATGDGTRGAVVADDDPLTPGDLTALDAFGNLVSRGMPVSTSLPSCAPVTGCQVTVTFSPAQVDTNYGIYGCMTVNPVGGILNLQNAAVLSTSSFSVNFQNVNTATSTGGTLYCLIIHP